MEADTTYIEPPVCASAGGDAGGGSVSPRDRVRLSAGDRRGLLTYR